MRKIIKNILFTFFLIFVFALFSNYVFSYDMQINGLSTQSGLPVYCHLNEDTYDCSLDAGDYYIDNKIYLDTSGDEDINLERLDLIINGETNFILSRDNATDNTIILGESENSSNFNSLVLEANSKLIIKEDFNYPFTVNFYSYIDNITIPSSSEFKILFESEKFFNFIPRDEYDFDKKDNFVKEEDFNIFKLESYLFNNPETASNEPYSFFGGVIDFDTTNIENKGAFEVKNNLDNFEIYPSDGSQYNYGCPDNPSYSFINEEDIYLYCLEFDIDTMYDDFFLTVTKKKYKTAWNNNYNYWYMNLKNTYDPRYIRINEYNDYKTKIKNVDNNSEFKIYNKKEKIKINKYPIINDDGEVVEHIDPLERDFKSLVFIEYFSGNNLPEILKNNNNIIFSTCKEYSNSANNIFDNLDYNISKLFYFSPDYNNSSLQSELEGISGIDNIDFRKIDCRDYVFNQEDEEEMYFYMPSSLKLNPFLLANIYDNQEQSYLPLDAFTSYKLHSFNDYSTIEDLNSDNSKDSQNNLIFYLDNFVTQNDYNLTGLYDMNLSILFDSENININNLFSLFKR